MLKNSNSKVMKIIFDSNPHPSYVSLEILVDNFGYFKKKSNLNIFDGNENCMKVAVAKKMFETLLKFIANGKFKLVVFIGI